MLRELEQRRPGLRLCRRRSSSAGPAGATSRCGCPRPPRRDAARARRRARTRSSRRTSCSSWLGGGRVFELKTVQVNDELVIPRPCIDMQHRRLQRRVVAGAEARAVARGVREGLDAASRCWRPSGALGARARLRRTIFDMSVGYDLAGHPQRAGAGLPPRACWTRGRSSSGCAREIPEECGALPRPRLHDAPLRHADALHLPRLPARRDRAHRRTTCCSEHGLHVRREAEPDAARARPRRGASSTTCSATATRIPDAAFEKDTTLGAGGRASSSRLGALGEGARARLRREVHQHAHRREPPRLLPGEREARCTSPAPPLHVLAMTLVRRFRAAFGDRFPISFSAGIDAAELRRRGGARARAGDRLHRSPAAGRLRARCGATSPTSASAWTRLGRADLDELRPPRPAATARRRSRSLGLRRASARGPAAPRSRARGDLRAAAGHGLRRAGCPRRGCATPQRYVERAARRSALRRRANNAKPPTKVGSPLALFDCLTCDKCVPVCPNDANFTYVLPQAEIPVVKLRAASGGGCRARGGGRRCSIEKKHQIANFADFCNECGNCDVFCPEDGGPYVVKPRFFGSEETFARFATHDGFFASKTEVLGCSRTSACPASHAIVRGRWRRSSPARASPRPRALASWAGRLTPNRG